MIEFTLSRVCMCVCGVLMLAAAVGYLGVLEDHREDRADNIASMLDSFQTSKLEELYLEGPSILPSGDFRVTVADGLVELSHGDGRFYSKTVYGSSFELDHGSSVTLTRSVPEGLGDVADRFGEDVHLLQAVIEVDGGPCTAVNAA